ncbi:MAG TPA: YHS domain-containing protein, partial [Roseiarcus sp.]|nr:YHS domain-containing protein [Roseiarcus sp.]
MTDALPDLGDERSFGGATRLENPAAAPALAEDPVCGMHIERASAKFTTVRDGQIHFFCSAGCRQKFIADPARYLRSTPTPAPRTYGPAAYACPMHPQVHADAPGLCSICGMSLEPQIPHGGGDADAERKDMARRFWIGLALTAPLIL